MCAISSLFLFRSLIFPPCITFTLASKFKYDDEEKAKIQLRHTNIYIFFTWNSFRFVRLFFIPIEKNTHRFEFTLHFNQIAHTLVQRQMGAKKRNVNTMMILMKNISIGAHYVCAHAHLFSIKNEYRQANKPNKTLDKRNRHTKLHCYRTDHPAICSSERAERERESTSTELCNIYKIPKRC